MLALSTTRSAARGSRSTSGISANVVDPRKLLLAIPATAAPVSPRNSRRLRRCRFMTFRDYAPHKRSGTASFRLCIRGDLLHSAVTLIDRDVRVGMAVGIRVGDVNASKWL